MFPAQTVIEKEVCRQHNVRVVGRTEAVRETYYAISVECRLRHPAVVAICRQLVIKYSIFAKALEQHQVHV